eukprot:412355_1
MSVSFFSPIVICLLLVSISKGSPSLNLKIDSQNSNGNNFYSINVNNAEWLQSGQIEGYFNHQWYTSNATLSQNNKDYKLMKLISSSTTYDHSDDFGGSYNKQIYEWQADTVIFQTNFKIYNDGKAISFVQYFPYGATGTNFIKATPNADCAWGLEVSPFLSFPSFNVNNMTFQKYSNGLLGYLTWTNKGNEIARWGQTPIPTDDLDGLQGAAVVLYDNSSINAIIISTNDNFALSTQTNTMNEYIRDTNNDWRLGISSEVLEIPPGFIHETVVVIGNGINDVTLN